MNNDEFEDRRRCYSGFGFRREAWLLLRAIRCLRRRFFLSSFSIGKERTSLEKIFRSNLVLSTVVEMETEAKLVLLISQKPLLWQQNNACRILTWSLKSVAFEYQPCQLIVYNARVILTRKSWKFTKCEKLFFCQKWLQKHLEILFCIRYDRIMIGYWIKSQKFSKWIFCVLGRFLYLRSCLQFFYLKGVLSKSACHSTKGQLDVKKVRI